jgi:predicted transcriptional regulator
MWQRHPEPFRRRSLACDMSDGGLWDAEARAFYGARLHRAVIARGWTADEFARMTRLNAASIHNAMRGRRVRDATAIRIFEALEKQQPMAVSLSDVPC